MATLSLINGRHVLQWHPAAGGRRQTLGLAGLRRRDAEAVCGHVTAIVAAQVNRTPLPDATGHWLQEIGGKLHARLVAKGLAAPRGNEAVAVGLDDFCKTYIGKRTDLKPGTLTILTRTRNSLVAYFGGDRDIRSITKGDALDWHRQVRTTKSAATAHLMGKKARQVFTDAVDRRTIPENPFRKLKLGASANPLRMVYVPAADVLTVIDATPDPEWKLLFSLARFEAARIPSEIRGLKWTDVALDTGRVTLRSPKTEHHEGRASRVVPIAPELTAILTDAFNAAEDGAVYVLPRLRLLTNPTTTAAKLIERAGLVPWVKTFQNLRSSCETDWAMRFPIHVACAWAGNTQAVAARHYLQVTDAHFEAASAARGAVEGPGKHRKSPEPPNAEVPVFAGDAANDWLPRGHNSSDIPSEKQREQLAALHHALHRVQIAFVKMLQTERPPPPCVPPAQGSALRARGGAR
jgi:integrase